MGAWKERDGRTEINYEVEGGEERRREKKGKNRRKEIFIKERKEEGSRTQEKKKRKTFTERGAFKVCLSAAKLRKGE